MSNKEPAPRHKCTFVLDLGKLQLKVSTDASGSVCTINDEVVDPRFFDRVVQLQILGRLSHRDWTAS